MRTARLGAAASREGSGKVRLLLELAQQEKLALQEIITSISSTLDLEQVLGNILRVVTRITGSHAGFLYLWDEPAEKLVLRAATSPYQRFRDRVELGLGEGINGWSALHQQPVMIRENALLDPRFKYVPELEEERFQSMMVAPIISRDGRVIGTISVNTIAPYEFTQDHLSMVTHVAYLVAGALENANLYSRLRELLVRTVAVQEEERRRIAIDIHDEVMQYVIGALYESQAAERCLEDAPGEAVAKLRSAQESLQRAVAEMYRVIFDLRPVGLDNMGLLPALRRQAAKFEGASGIRCRVTSSGAAYTLPAGLDLVVYRVVQEALSNARKHARATGVRVNVRFGRDAISVSVTDDGTGFVPQSPQGDGAGHFGLMAMRDRALSVKGELRVRSAPGRGTTVSLRVPLAAPEGR